MPALRTLCGAGGEKHLERRVGEHHRAHVAPIGHQPRCAPEGQLQAMQGLAHGRQCRNARGQAADLLTAQLVADRAAAQEHRAAFEAQVQHRGQPRQRRLVVGRYAIVQRSQRRGAIQRAGVQCVVAQPRGQCRGQRAFARRGGAIDSDHRHVLRIGAGHAEQRLEIVGKGLCHAARVEDAHRQARPA